jgi:hypothetical protein
LTAADWNLPQFCRTAAVPQCRSETTLLAGLTLDFKFFFKIFFQKLFLRLKSEKLGNCSTRVTARLLPGLQAYFSGGGRWRRGCFRESGEAGVKCDSRSSGGGRGAGANGGGSLIRVDVAPLRVAPTASATPRPKKQSASFGLGVHPGLSLTRRFSP